MEPEINHKKQISIIDWLVIYVSTVVLINFLVKNQIYPSQWISSLLPGGMNDVNLLFVHEILQCGLIVGGVLLFLHIRGTSIQQIGWQAPQNAQNYVRAIVYGVLTCSLMLMLSAFLTQIFVQNLLYLRDLIHFPVCSTNHLKPFCLHQLWLSFCILLCSFAGSN